MGSGMKGPRRIGVWPVAGVAVATALIAWLAIGRSGERTKVGTWQKTVHSMATNPVEFTKVRLTGGIGVAVNTNEAGFLIIYAVKVGSPAEKAGLKAKDVVTHIDGERAPGNEISWFTNRVTGFTGGKLALTIQRDGLTNMQCVVQRASWNTLQSLPYINRLWPDDAAP
jgi:S1-C subfamily serine protease